MTTARRRMGLRARITAVFALGALALSAALALATYELTRSSLLEDRERASIRAAYFDAAFIRTGLGGEDPDISAALQALDTGELRPDAGEVLLGGEPVHLTRTEFRLLCELAEQVGHVLSRGQLLTRVWEYDFGDERLVDVHVGRLRRKIEADPADPRHLVTVRGLGYKLQR